MQACRVIESLRVFISIPCGLISDKSRVSDDVINSQGMKEFKNANKIQTNNPQTIARDFARLQISDNQEKSNGNPQLRY